MTSKKPFAWMLVMVCLLSGSLVASASAQEVKEEDPAMSSLDEELFNDLGSDLFNDIDLPDETQPKPEMKPAKNEEPKPGKTTKPGEAAKLGEKTDDEQAGPRGMGADQTDPAVKEDPLSKIGGMMREVQKRISGGQAETKTVAMQQEIIEEIEKLLNQDDNSQNNQSQSGGGSQSQNQNQQQQNQSGSGQQQQNQSQGGQPQGGNPQQGNQAGQQKSQGQQQGQPMGQEGSGDSNPAEGRMQGEQESKDAQNSSDKLRDQDTLPISPEEQDALVKKAWGNLPPHLRKQISNSSMERFLPKYERLTQEYFRKLAEIEE
ncbi:hypothetical protein GC197_04870 [bacterium]|nr:hypothetical protein [bacterium]